MTGCLIPNHKDKPTLENLEKTQNKCSANKENKRLSLNNINWAVFEQMTSVSCIPKAAKKAPATFPTTEETETMIANTSEDNARRHLRDRAMRLNHQHEGKMEEHFHICEPDPPKDIEEVIERFTSGKVTIRPKDQRKPYHSWHDHFTWRDPAKPADHDGFNKAKEKLSHDYQHLTDAIMVKAPLDAMKDVHSFESKTYH